MVTEQTRAHYEAMAAEADAINDGGPAFPIPNLHHDEDFNGMTLRDYFAAKCMPLVAAQWARDNAEAWDNGFDRMARIAYEMADAMLRVREVKA